MSGSGGTCQVADVSTFIRVKLLDIFNIMLVASKAKLSLSKQNQQGCYN